MGTTRLKKKEELNYRLGHKGCWCDECEQFVEHFHVHKCDGTFHRIDSRCKVMGLKSSRRYAVRSIYCCDRFEPKRASEEAEKRGGREFSTFRMN